MRNVAIGLGGLFVVSAIVSVNLWRELRSERVLTEQLRTELNASRAAEASLRQGAAAAALRAPAVLVSPVASSSSPADERKPPVAAAPVLGPVASVAAPDLQRFMLDQQEVMKDPEFRAARLAQIRATVMQSNPGLVDDLGLNPQEASRLFDVLAELQLDGASNAIVQSVNGRPDAATAQRLIAANQEQQRQREEAVSQLLGPSKFAQWKEYVLKRPAYMQASQINRMIEGAGQPSLNDAQMRAMREVYVAEQQRQRDDKAQFTRSVASVGPGGPAFDPSLMEQQSKLQEGRNTRIIEAAQRHLAPGQVEALRTQLEQQLVMARAQSRLMRERLENQKPPGP